MLGNYQPRRHVTDGNGDRWRTEVSCTKERLFRFVSWTKNVLLFLRQTFNSVIIQKTKRGTWQQHLLSLIFPRLARDAAHQIRSAAVSNQQITSKRAFRSGRRTSLTAAFFASSLKFPRSSALYAEIRTFLRGGAAERHLGQTRVEDKTK